MNSNKKYFLFVLVLIVLTRVLDAVTTYIGSSDLKFESNPVVRNFHMGWVGLAIETSVITAAIIYLSYLCYLRPLDYGKIPYTAISSLMSFSIYISYGIKGQLSYFLYRTPRVSVLSRLIGYASGITIIVFGVYVIINNIMFIFDSYAIAKLWVRLGGENRVTHFFVILTTFLISCVLFYRREYARAILSNGLIEK